MPELSGIHIGMLALMLVIGVVAGWLIRADRCAKEKLAANAELEKKLDSGAVDPRHVCHVDHEPHA